MTVEQAIGDRLRRVRTKAGLSQADVGSSLTRFLGKSWSRQAVWAAEQGQRAFTAVELYALAQVLDVSPAWLLGPQSGDDQCMYPTGLTIVAPTSDGPDGIAERLERATGLMAEAQEILTSLRR